MPEHICHMLLGNGEVSASVVSPIDLRFIAIFLATKLPVKKASAFKHFRCVQEHVLLGCIPTRRSSLILVPV